MDYNNSINVYEQVFNLAKTDFISFCLLGFNLMNNNKFVMGYGQKVIASTLIEQCINNNKSARLIINCPPRLCKTTLCSIFLPAYLLGHNPSVEIMVISYNETMASDITRKIREILCSDFYRKIFPGTVLTKKQENIIETSKNGHVYACGINGTITGRGADYIIIDDPLKANDAYSNACERVNSWFYQTVPSRLNNKNTGKIILVMQRLCEDDLSGYLLKTSNWQHLCLAAIAEADEKFEINGQIFKRNKGEILNPNFDSIDFFYELKRSMSDADFSAQYQQNPKHLVGNVINVEDFDIYSGSHVISPTIIQSWDIALADGKSNDYSVCITASFEDGCLFIIDIFRDKLRYPNLFNKTVELIENYHPTKVLVEESPISLGFIQDLQLKGYPISPVYPKGNKIVRANLVSRYIKEKRILLPKYANWLDDFKSECAKFPTSSVHDDQVDALSQFSEFLGNNDVSKNFVRKVQEMYSSSLVENQENSNNNICKEPNLANMSDDEFLNYMKKIGKI